MKSTSEMLLIVHVPKTAGTSLRLATEKYFGTEKVIRDYGPNAKATTNAVQRLIYQGKPDKEALIRHMSDCGARVLVGHFKVLKYADFFPPERIIAFVREPLERACSEFLHRTGNQSFSGTFDEFISRRPRKNIQSRFLEGISTQSFVGLTEYYAESLRYINEYHNVKLALMKSNKNRRGGGARLLSRLSTEQKDIFLANNQADIDLYEETKSRFLALKIPLTRLERVAGLFKPGSSSPQNGAES